MDIWILIIEQIGYLFWWINLVDMIGIYLIILKIFEFKFILDLTWSLGYQSRVHVAVSRIQAECCIQDMTEWYQSLGLRSLGTVTLVISKFWIMINSIIEWYQSLGIRILGLNLRRVYMGRPLDWVKLIWGTFLHVYRSIKTKITWEMLTITCVGCYGMREWSWV